MAERCTLLTYDYVPDMQERREPYREQHLALISSWKDKGRLLLVGALADPPRALFVFASEVESTAFMTADPYAQHGLVTDHRTEPIVVV